MKAIYLEPDEEITSIIDRLSKISESKIAVVVPKNSTMFQSLVNLKLLARQAQKLGKSVAIISNNKVSSRLAKQVGLETYASLGTVASSPSVLPGENQTSVPEPPGPDTLPDGTPIHRYSPEVSMQQLAASNLPLAEDGRSGDEETKSDSEPEASSQELIAPVAGAEVTPNEPVASSQLPEAPSSLPPIVSRGLQSRHQFVFPWKSAFVAVTMALVVAIITFLFLPKATVTLTFPAKLLTETFALSVKTNASGGEGVIGGSLLTVEKSASKELVATGKKDVGTKAGGTISLKNCEDTNSHSLVAGSKVSATGKVFNTAAAVTIPAGQFSGGGTVCNSTSVTVDIAASDAGDAYNLTAATFSIAGLAGRISGTGSTTGGTTKQITILSPDDLSSAYNDLKTQLGQDGTNELKGKASGQTVINEAIKTVVIEQKVDKEVGAQTDRATASMTLDLFTIAFDQVAVETVAKDILTTKLAANEQLIIPNDRKSTTVFKDLTDDRTTLNLGVTASGFAAPNIDKGAVAASVKNQSLTAAENFLKSRYSAEEVKIEIIPSWWLKRLPILPQAIGVEYGFNEATK